MAQQPRSARSLVECCGRTYTTDVLSKHKERKHKPCEYCGHLFINDLRPDYMVACPHAPLDVETLFYSCSKCGNWFETKDARKQHEGRHHAECDDCHEVMLASKVEHHCKQCHVFQQRLFLEISRQELAGEAEVQSTVSSIPQSPRSSSGLTTRTEATSFDLVAIDEDVGAMDLVTEVMDEDGENGETEIESREDEIEIEIENKNENNGPATAPERMAIDASDTTTDDLNQPTPGFCILPELNTAQL